jgi:hypothetical protein
MKNLLHDSSRKARRRARPALEPLEDRLNPGNLDFSAAGAAAFTANPGELNDITLNLNQATGRYQFTDNGAVITVSGAGSGAGGANDQGAGTNAVTFQASFITSISIDTGDLADFVTVQSTSVPTTVTTSATGDANPTVTLGNAGSLQGIMAPVTIGNANALSTVVLDDSADPTGRTVTVSDTAVTGLAPAPINYTAADLGALTVNGGTGRNNFTVTDTILNITSVLNTGTGNDTVTVQAGSTLNVNGQGGNDQFKVTPSADAAFNFNGGSGSSTLDFRGTGALTPNGANAGTINAAGDQPVAFASIPVANVLNGHGSLQFSAATFTANENGSSATITVTRTGGASGAVSVQFTATAGTAAPGQNFTPTTQTVTFADDDTTPKTITVPILDDQVVTSNLTVNLALSNPTGGANLGTPSTAVLTILETDQPVNVTGQSQVVLGKLKGTKKARQKVTITNHSGRTFVGPLTLILAGLNRKTTLTNESGVSNGGDPLLTVGSDLAPGASLTLTLQFRNPKLKRIKFAQLVFAEGLR